VVWGGEREVYTVGDVLSISRDRRGGLADFYPYFSKNMRGCEGG
jgi:NADH:ubiquinone oxidoreductase subunit E